jgi:hypothetical protein
MLCINVLGGLGEYEQTIFIKYKTRMGMMIMTNESEW